jgi:hypothetical protein
MKVTCEVDTDTREAKVMIDGQEVSVLEFSIGHYVSTGCGDSEEHKCTYVSLTQGDTSNRYSQSISFDDQGNGNYSESRTKMSVAKEIGKSVARLITAAKLGDALLKKS